MRTAAAAAMFLVVPAIFAAPQVAITRFPHGIMPPVGGATEHDDFDLANSGPDPASVTVQGTKTFFTVSPAQFVLDPGAKRTITILPAVTAGGLYDGAADIFIAGIKDPLTVPVRLFIGGRPNGIVTPVALVSSVVISPAAGQGHSAAPGVRNNGNVTMQGLLVADVPWIVPQNANVLSIGAGSNLQMAFNVDV